MTQRKFCRDCGHWEHDPGSCDGLGHVWNGDLPVVTDCACEVYDDQRGEVARFIHKIAEMPDDAMVGYTPGRVLQLLRAKARQLEQYDD